MELLDRAILALTNAVIYARAPRAIRHYWRHIRRLPDVAFPRRYSERMLWRKLVDHNPQFVVFTDKLATKEFQRSACPDLALPRVLWVGYDADAIPDDLLTRDVYVKTNHGFNFHCRLGGQEIDRSSLKRETERWMHSVHGVGDYQWAYGQVRPRLFVEEAIGDARGELLDFCVFACDGEVIRGAVLGHNKTPQQWYVRLDTESGEALATEGTADTTLSSLPEGIEISEPFKRAMAYTRRLSVGVDYARFDFMWNGTELYGGEITVYPGAGITDIADKRELTRVLSAWDLRVSHFLRSTHRGWTGLYAEALRRQIGRTNPVVPSLSVKEQRREESIDS